MASEKDLDIVTHTDQPPNQPQTFEDGVSSDQFDPVEVKRIFRKIDHCLLPILTALYLMTFLDRSNIGNARTAGMFKSPNLTSEQYTLTLTVFFFPYAFFEVPSNIVLKVLRPSIWLPIIVLSRGTVMTLMGIVQGYRGLLATMFFVGFCEAGLFPAASWILRVPSLGCWRLPFQKMGGVAGLEGRRWILVLEGLLTVTIGLTLPFVLLDSPETSIFLTPAEKTLHIRRLHLDYTTTKNRPIAWRYARQALTDWKIHASILVFWGNAITGYGSTFGLSTTIASLGHPASSVQLLTIPAYIVALLAVMLTAHHSDKLQRRAEFIIHSYMLCALCFVATMALPKSRWPGARYGIIFVITAGL